MTRPMHPTGFADLGLSPSLLQVVQELGFEALTPIQAQSIPHLLGGADLIGQSSTGSGKTAAFTLPILERLRLPQRRLQALVLCPTRELCAQVAREMRRLGRRHPGLQVLVVSGGMPSGPQRAALEKGVHIVVGTPGRVLDMIGRDRLDLAKVGCVVLDEADRMLDMGFLDDMEAILAATPATRQTVFFSATFPESIDAMSRTYQRRPVRVTIGEEAARAPDIRQLLCETPRERKLSTLKDLLGKHKQESTLVFCNHKATVDELAAALAEAGLSTAALHGGLEQRDRDRVLAKFRNQSVRVLLATDVAARGLDVDSLDLVINFDLPGKPDTYVHRIGRTGRAGRSGLAISLVTAADGNRIAAIEAILDAPLERCAISSYSRLPAQAAAEMPLASPPAAMETLYIAGGRRDKLRPGDILGALTGEAAGLDASQIGKIEIHDTFAYVAVVKSAVQAALHGLREGRIKGRKFQVELVR